MSRAISRSGLGRLSVGSSGFALDCRRGQITLHRTGDMAAFLDGEDLLLIDRARPHEQPFVLGSLPSTLTWPRSMAIPNKSVLRCTRRMMRRC